MIVSRACLWGLFVAGASWSTASDRSEAKLIAQAQVPVVVELDQEPKAPDLPSLDHPPEPVRDKVDKEERPSQPGRAEELDSLDFALRDLSREFWQHMQAGDRARVAHRFEEAKEAYTHALQISPRMPAALQGRLAAGRSQLKSAQGSAGAKIAKECPKQVLEDAKTLWMDIGRPPSAASLREVLDLAVAPDQGAGSRCQGQELDLQLDLISFRLSYADAPAVAHRWLERASLLHKRARARGLDVSREDLVQAQRDLIELRSRLEAQQRLFPLSAELLLAQILAATKQWGAAARLSQELLSQRALKPEAKVLVSGILDAAQWEQEIGTWKGTAVVAPEAHAHFVQSIGHWEQRRVTAALEALEAALKISPRFAQAYFLRGQILSSQPAQAKLAIESLRRALRLDSAHHAALALLAQLYLEEFPPQREAAKRALTRANKIRPDLPAYPFALAKLWAKDEIDEGRRWLDQYFARAQAQDPLWSKAQALKEELDSALKLKLSAQELAPFGDALEGDGANAEVEVPAELLRLLRKVQRLQLTAAEPGSGNGKGSTLAKDAAREALAALVQASERYTKQVALWNARARIEAQLGDIEVARKSWRKSLELDPYQAGVHEELASHLDFGNEARKHYERAAELGSFDARLQLAQREAGAWRWYKAYRAIERWKGVASPLSIRRHEGERLAEYIHLRFYLLLLIAGAAGILLLGLGARRLWLRHRGWTVAEFLSAYPESSSEVAAVLALLRHEVLKHNTAVLSEIRDLVAGGRLLDRRRISRLAQRVYGEPAKRNFGGILAMYRSCVAELEQIARGRGARLNLEYRDPLFSPLSRAFRALSRIRNSLADSEAASGWSWGNWRGRGDRDFVLDRLQEAIDVLGPASFRDLSQTLRAIAQTEVDPGFLDSCFEQVAGENQFIRSKRAKWTAEGEGAKIEAGDFDLRSIFCNLIRNAWASSMAAGQNPVELACQLELEVEEITGLQTLALRFLDRSPEPLDPEFLKNSALEHGSGILADRLQRCDASLTVESQPHWEKAVVLRFFVDSPEVAGMESRREGSVL